MSGKAEARDVAACRSRRPGKGAALTNYPAIIKSAAEICRSSWTATDEAIRCTRIGRRGTGPRQRRSSIRWAIAYVGAQLVEFCDVATSTIGYRDHTGTWCARGVDDIAGFSAPSFVDGKWTTGARLDAREHAIAYRRTQRALAILEEAGYLRTIQRRERGTTTPAGWTPNPIGMEYRSRNAVRKLTAAFWRALGVELTMVRERNVAIARLAAKKPRAAELAAADVAALTARLARRKGWRPAPDSAAAAESRAHAAIDDALRREHPSLPAGERAARAWQILRARSRH